MIGALGLGLGGAVAGTLGTALSNEYQWSMMEDQQEFIERQNENQIKFNVQQMKDLGYSPSMLFGGNTPSGGGHSGAGMGKAQDFSGPILQAINTVGNLWMKDKELDNKNKYLDILEEKAISQNAVNTAVALNNGAQEQYWMQMYNDLQRKYPLN